MSSPAEHRALREALGLHALGRLDPAERAAVQAHLDGCAACRAELAELAGTARLLGGVDPDLLATDVAVPADLGERVVAAVRSERAAAPPDAPVAPVVALRPRRRWRGAVAAAAAGVVVLAAVGVGYGLAPGAPTGPELEQVPALAAPGSGVVASAELVPHTWGLEIKLAATGFVAGEDYTVRVLADGAAAGAGQFVGVGATEMHCNLSSSVLRADADGFEVLDDTGAVVLTAAF